MKGEFFMPKISEEKLIIIIGALSQLTVQLIANMATVILPEISMELNVSTDLQLWINIIYLCVLVALAIPLAKVISQYGIKKSVKISYVLFIISLIVCSMSFNFYMVLLGRFLQGLACSSLIIGIYMMLVEELEDEALGVALGITGSAGYIGLMMAPAITSFITYYTNWRMAFLMLLPLFIIQLIMLHMVKSEWTTEKKPIDNIGSLIYMLMMVFFTIGLTEIDAIGPPFILAALVLLIIFIRYEKRQEYPILNVSLLRNVQLMIGSYAAWATYFVTTIATTVLTFHLVYPMNMDLNLVGIVLLVTPLTMVFISIMAGRLSVRIDPRLISGCALLIILVSMLMFACLAFLPMALIIVACVIQGIGHGLFSSPNNKYVLTLPDEDDLGDTSAMLSTSKELGKIISSGIYTVLFAVMLKDVVLGPSKYDMALLFTNHLMMTVTVLVVITAAAALFYSLYKYERYENEAIVALAYRLMPDSLKKRAKKAGNIKETVVETTLSLKDVFGLRNLADTAGNIKDTTIDTATNIKDTTIDTATTIKDTTIDTAKSTKDTAMNLKDKLK